MNIEIYCELKNKKQLEFCMKKCKIPIVKSENDSLENEIANYNCNDIELKQLLNLTAYCLIQTNYTNNPIHGKYASIFIHEFYD